MLNILSLQPLRKKKCGPVKLAENLIKWLKLINEPYIINWDPQIFRNIYAIDWFFSKELMNAPKDAEILIWPITSQKGKDIEKYLNNYTFVYASNRIKNIWDNHWWHKKSICRPVWIDTHKYKPSQEKRDRVLIYTKRRKEEEYNSVVKILEKLQIKYCHIDYDKWYSEWYFINQLKKTKYTIRIWWSETQWIAIWEILAMDVPILLRDIKKVINYEKSELRSDIYTNNEINEFATSAEYFDKTCWIKFYNWDEVENNIKLMEKSYKNFKPRQYIIKNLSLEKQAKELISFYSNPEQWNNLKMWLRNKIRNFCLKLFVPIIDTKIYKHIQPFILKTYYIIFKK